MHSRRLPVPLHPILFLFPPPPCLDPQFRAYSSLFPPGGSRTIPLGIFLPVVFFSFSLFCLLPTSDLSPHTAICMDYSRRVYFFDHRIQQFSWIISAGCTSSIQCWVEIQQLALIGKNRPVHYYASTPLEPPIESLTCLVFGSDPAAFSVFGIFPPLRHLALFS